MDLVFGDLGGMGMGLDIGVISSSVLDRFDFFSINDPTQCMKNDTQLPIETQAVVL